MPTYRVEKAQEAKRLPPKDDRPELAVHAYTLSENGDTYDVERVAKLTTPLPAVGSMIEGTIEDGRFGKRFKPTTAGGNGFRKRDPSETRRIERQHAQHMALQYIAIKASIGALPSVGDKQGFDLSDVFTLADQFDRDLDPAPAPSDTPNDPNA